MSSLMEIWILEQPYANKMSNSYQIISQVAVTDGEFQMDLKEITLDNVRLKIEAESALDCAPFQSFKGNKWFYGTMQDWNS